MQESGKNGPGSFRSDWPRPSPNSPPSAWVNSAAVIWPAPSGASRANGSTQMSIRSWTWPTVPAKNAAPAKNMTSPISTYERRFVAT